MSSSSSDIRVVVGIDFGTTYSGYAYAHKSNPNEIKAQDSFKGHFVHGIYKTPTVIRYDDDSYTNVNSWGFPALEGRPDKRRSPSHPSTSRPIELFKLLLLGSVLTDKPFIPDKLDYKKVISDYLKELRKDVKKTIESHWLLDFHENIMIVLTVPAEFNDNAISILRECALNAELIKEKDSGNLIFTTEPEAAAIHSMDSLKKEHKLKPGDSFMIVDCGGGTVDLTTRELTEDDKLLEITERSGDFCGSCCIDKEFVEFLGKNIGKGAIDNLKENRYTDLQYLVQEFCARAKIPFTGQSESFETFDIDLDEKEYKVIKECIEDDKKKDELAGKEWMIEVKFEDVKKMFDPIIERIFTLIRGQLGQLKRRSKKVSVILLVGGFGGSKYLQSRIKNEFTTEVSDISVSTEPIVAIMKGAVKYGLEEEIVKSRILKWTYGTDVVRKWQPTDPLSQKLPNGCIKVFEILAERGKQVSLSDKVIRYFKPYSIQRKMGFNMYVTSSNSAEYFNDSEIKLLREWEIKMNSSSSLDDYDEDDDIDIISLSLGFGQVEICATAENSKTGDKHEVTFKQDFA
ncbi:hypothetical protein Glove_243g60 [Diversispora epigaea]|uniref:Actin-like ATPase domain-containing protein n=1 Tax=Diversispora epigaea TaxID=1348612 RepID=A0A397IGZ3_9GLOM|nr:hypothetical protein Glove_243g60 [Diversispora epigaea]